MNTKNKKEYKVLFLVSSLKYGGVERVVSDIANNLDIDNLKLVLYENKLDYECNREKLFLNSPPGSNYFSKFFKFIKRIVKLRKIKKKEKPDCTISFSDGPNLVNILSKNKDKILISVLSNKSQGEGVGFITKKIYNLFYKFFYKKADKIFCVSKGVKDSLVQEFNINNQIVDVIYNPIDIKLINKKTQDPIEDKWIDIFNSPTIINVGRLSKPKGQWHLIRAFAKVKNKIPRAKLIILGGGELKEYLINLSKSLKLKTYSIWEGGDLDDIQKNDVFFLGFQENPFKFISSSDLLAFPSLWEGFSVALVEALSCGIPIIASDCRSGPRELLAPKTNFKKETKIPEFVEYGILMPVCDGKMYDSINPLTVKEKAWVDILSKSLQNENLVNKYSKKGHIRAKSFNIDEIVKKWKKEILLP